MVIFYTLSLGHEIAVPKLTIITGVYRLKTFLLSLLSLVCFFFTNASGHAISDLKYWHLTCGISKWYTGRVANDWSVQVSECCALIGFLTKFVC